MTAWIGRGVLAVITGVLLLALGAGVAVVAGDALGIRSEAAQQMSPADPVVPEVAAAVASPSFTTIAAPEGVRIGVALDELRDASAAAATAGEASLTVVAGDGDPGDDTYRLTGTATALRVDGTSEAGAVRGVYDLAAAIRAGRGVAGKLGQTVTSRLGLRMVDLGAVGVTADPSQWRSGTDYSHASKAFADVYLPDAPYVDQAALNADFAEWDTFLRHSIADGYNAVAWPGFIEYTDFATAPDGPVYRDGDEHIARARALREAFSPYWRRAAQLGVGVYLRTDMLSLTPELESYLDAYDGTADPRLWRVYTAALDELYAAEPALSGVLVRIGEGGSIYDLPGWDYYSKLAVTSVDAVRTMLRAFTTQAEASGRDVIFRTWSVGIGAVGDMHTDPASYEQVLDGIDSPALIVSTKYTLGDFYSWLPLNDTLAQGDQRRIVEFQSRREFEAFGSFPNDLGPEFQWAMQRLLAANPRIEGVWTWTQDGGPWRAGPMSLYLKAGFWQLYELNTLAAVAIARDPDVDIEQVTLDWARRYFSDDPATVAAIAQAMTQSRDAIMHGLYVEPFAKRRVFAVGLEPPPQMWLFEWDILTGDTATLDVMATIVGDRIDDAIADGKRAGETARGMRDLVGATDAATWRDPTLRAAFTGTLDYEVDVLELLSSYREMFLRQAQWHATLSPDAYARWSDARDAFEARAATHLKTYDGDVNYPAWNLTAAQLGVQRADRDLAMAWAARVLLLLALAWLLIGMFSARTRLVRRPGAGAARATWLASTRPWRARESTLGMLRLDRWLLVLIPGALLVATRAVQTSLLAPAHVAVVLGAWAVFVGIVLLLLRGRAPWAVLAAVGGAVVLRCVLTLIALSLTGPGGYWYVLWTDPVRRSLYITVAFAAFVWVFVAAAWALAVSVGARRATGIVLAGVGLALAVPAAVIGFVGLEQALTVWNDQLGLLPWGLARILGITTYLEIPDATALWAAALGVGLAVIGVVLALAKRRPRLPGR